MAAPAPVDYAIWTYKDGKWSTSLTANSLEGALSLLSSEISNEGATGGAVLPVGIKP